MNTETNEKHRKRNTKPVAMGTFSAVSKVQDKAKKEEEKDGHIHRACGKVAVKLISCIGGSDGKKIKNGAHGVPLDEREDDPFEDIPGYCHDILVKDTDDLLYRK